MAELAAVNNALFGDDDSDSDSGVEKREELVASTNAPRYAVVVDTLNSIGGNRGIIANPLAHEDVPAGSLLLAEAPMISWTESDVDLSDPSGVEKAIRELLQPRNQHVLKVCQIHLYPQLKVFSNTTHGEEINQIKTHLLGEIHLSSLLRDFPFLVEIEIIQLVAVLKHNGLLSGLYRNISMLNHSCDPNCIVFKPKPSSLHMAEVWSTKKIKRGEECLITYCPSSSPLYLPQDQSIENIRLFLSEQHGFKCLCSRCLLSLTNEKDVGDESNNLCEDNDTIDAKFELELMELERDVLLSKLRPLNEMADECRRVISWVSKYIDSQIMESSRAAQVASKASITPSPQTKAASAIAAIGQYFHVSTPLLARAAKLAINAASIGMELLSNENSSSSLYGKIKYFGLKFLTLNLQLEKLQRTYIGNDHPDLARTYQDISEIIDGMMANETPYLEKHFEKIATCTDNIGADGLRVQSMKDLKFFSKECRKKGTDLQNMYNRRKRYISSLLITDNTNANDNGKCQGDDETGARVFWGKYT